MTAARRGLFVPLLVLALALSSCAPRATQTGPAPVTASGVLPAATATEQATSSLTFVAEADAQVNEAEPDRNAGQSTFLQVDGAGDLQVESLIRFTVSGVPGTVQAARLRLYDTTNASENGPAVYATDPSWTEHEITWANRPERTGAELDNETVIAAESWVEYDVTAVVTGNGTYSFVLAADSRDAATFSSREGSQAPLLVITIVGGSASAGDIPTSAAGPSATSTGEPVGPARPFTLAAEADARVLEAEADNNFGSGTTLRADGEGDSVMESFIRFTVPEGTGPIESARLQLYVTDNGTSDGPALFLTDPSWSESDITWNTRPGRSGAEIANSGPLHPESWTEFDVTSVVTGSGTYSFVLVPESGDGVVFSSRQGDRPPQLILNGGAATPTATNTAPVVMPTFAPTGDEAILVGAGDISTCSNDNDELTARLLDSIPGTVFTAGDNVYDEGTMAEYLSCYEPTWGRHKERTRPSPGNHEYLTSGAAGYFQYFGNVPSYYVYTLGGWRIYALNSEIDVSETSAQITWLKADLAANPAQCVLAYWHQPRWSSGTHHGSDRDYQPLWQVLYEAGAELVINGHEHHYERFAEMNAAGEASSPGLREIVVGTGGRNQYDFGPPLAASEVRDDTSFGVLKLTLRGGGYEWEFVPAEGSSFTDRGSGACH